MVERPNKWEAATEEAAQWFVRLRDDNLELGERLSYVRWLKQSPAHLREMLRICQLAGWLQGARLEQLVSQPGHSPSILEFSTCASNTRVRITRSPARMRRY